MINIRSLIRPSAMVTIDPYGSNPVADDLEALDPAAYTEAVRYGGRAPRMFDGGGRDLPAATASGIDPIWLCELPYTARHYAADLPTEAAVHALFERHAGEAGARYDHPGLDAAVARVKAWAAAEDTDRAASVAASQPAPRAASSTRQRSFATVEWDADTVREVAKRGVVLPPFMSAHRGAPSTRIYG